MYFNSPPLTRMARKRHICSWCGEVIEKLSVYQRRFCCGDGAGSTIKQHPECAAAERRFYSHTGESEWEPGTFTRGCTCESGDTGHGTYDTCTKEEPK
jgi:hypothetical protein